MKRVQKNIVDNNTLKNKQAMTEEEKERLRAQWRQNTRKRRARIVATQRLKNTKQQNIIEVVEKNHETIYEIGKIVDLFYNFLSLLMLSTLAI